MVRGRLGVFPQLGAFEIGRVTSTGPGLQIRLVYSQDTGQHVGRFFGLVSPA